MKTTSLQLMFAGIVSALLAWPVIVPQAIAADMSMEEMIANAKTRADHEAIAKFYEDEASAYQTKAQEHKKMEGAYRNMSHGKGGVAGFVAHCKKMVTQYEELAKEDLELAKLHRQFADKVE